MPSIHQQQVETDPAIITFSSEFRWLDNVNKASSQNPSYPASEPVITMTIIDDLYLQELHPVCTENHDVSYLDLNNSGGNRFSRDVCISIPHAEPWGAPTFHALQEWEGFVTEINEKTFVARLVDLKVGQGTDEEEARIPLSVLSDQDKAKLRLGSIFRWVIGYERHVTGRRRTGSEIVLRDVPLITEDDLRDGEVWAREVISSFDL